MTVNARLPLVLCLGVLAASCQGVQPKAAGRSSDPKQAAQRMIRAAEGGLAPVYAPLAEQIAQDFNLAGKTGVGIDLGSGPGTLIIELCKRSKMHWINADINPYFFPYFLRQAEKHGMAGRVSAVRADACNLPFIDGYADVIVSRGSFHFWPDREKAFREAYRVLKPGGVAYIGRGFSRELPIETARRIRSKRGGPKKYDPAKQADGLRTIMARMGVRDYRITLPEAPGGADINYGVWIEFRKPAAVEK